MARTKYLDLTKAARPRKAPVIDNRRYPTTEEVGRLLKIPASRVRELKKLADEIIAAYESRPK